MRRCCSSPIPFRWFASGPVDWSARQLKAIALSALLVIAATTIQAAQPAMTIAFSGQTLIVSGASPGSEVLVFGAYQHMVGYFAAYDIFQEFVVDDGHDGIVKFDFRGPIPRRSVWVAIDTRNGDYAVAAPAGYPVKLSDLPTTAIAKSKTGDDALSLSFAAAEILILRPGGSAWRGKIDRSGTSDERDADPMKLLVSASRLMALRGREPGPRAIRPGDLIIAINPLTLEALIHQAGK